MPVKVGLTQITFKMMLGDLLYIDKNRNKFLQLEITNLFPLVI